MLKCRGLSFTASDLPILTELNTEYSELAQELWIRSDTSHTNCIQRHWISCATCSGCVLSSQTESLAEGTLTNERRIRVEFPYW